MPEQNNTASKPPQPSGALPNFLSPNIGQFSSLAGQK